MQATSATRYATLCSGNKRPEDLSLPKVIAAELAVFHPPSWFSSSLHLLSTSFFSSSSGLSHVLRHNLCGLTATVGW